MFYFGVYEILMSASQKRFGGDRSKIPMHEIVLYGSLGGVTLWVSTFPFDVVKSKMRKDLTLEILDTHHLQKHGITYNRLKELEVYIEDLELHLQELQSQMLVYSLHMKKQSNI